MSCSGESRCLKSIGRLSPALACSFPRPSISPTAVWVSPDVDWQDAPHAVQRGAVQRGFALLGPLVAAKACLRLESLHAVEERASTRVVAPVAVAALDDIRAVVPASEVAPVSSDAGQELAGSPSSVFQTAAPDAVPSSVSPLVALGATHFSAPASAVTPAGEPVRDASLCWVFPTEQVSILVACLADSVPADSGSAHFGIPAMSAEAQDDSRLALELARLQTLRFFLRPLVSPQQLSAACLRSPSHTTSDLSVPPESAAAAPASTKCAAQSLPCVRSGSDRDESR